MQTDRRNNEKPQSGWPNLEPVYSQNVRSIAVFRTLSKAKTRSLNIRNQGRQRDQGNSKQKGVVMGFPETGATFCNDDLFRFYAHSRAP
jgi:hypothetical protein